MHLTIEDAQLKQLTAAAIVQTLTPEARDKLITDAVIDLLKPSNACDQKTPLERAFNWAVSDVCREIAKNELADNGLVKEKIKTLVQQALERVFASDLVTNKIATAIETALCSRW